MNINIKTLLIVFVSLVAISGTVFIQHNLYQKVDNRLNGLEIRINGSPEQLVGGVTKVIINTGTKWITDLVPSASYTPNIGSAANPVLNYFGSGASFSGNINFLGELKPDGVLCANGEILKKTGAN